MSFYTNYSQMNDKRSNCPNLNINFNLNKDKPIKANTYIDNENLEYKGSNIYPINNKGKNEFTKKNNNKSSNLNYLNHKTQSYNKKYNIEINENSNPSQLLINEDNKKKIKNIDYFQNYDLKKYKEYLNKKLYIISETNFSKINSRKTVQLFSTSSFITSSEEFKNHIKYKRNFYFIDENSNFIHSLVHEGNHVFLYEIEQKKYLFFPNEGNIIEIPKKNDIYLDENKKKEEKNENIINNGNTVSIINQNSSQQSMKKENQISTNEEDEETITIKALILLYGFQKNFIKLMKSPIIDEYDFKEYYLINRDWIDDFKASFNISAILDMKNYNYSYKGFSKNIEKIKKDIKANPFQNQNKIILNSNKEFYPELKEVNTNQELIYPVNFELVPEDLFNLLFKIANKGNLKKDDKYRYQVLIGDNVLFVQNKKLNNIFYAYIFNKDSKLKIFCLLLYFKEENYYKDVRKFIKEKGFINFLIERNIDIAIYNNKPLIVKDREEEQRFKFVILSKINTSEFEALKIKHSLKNNKKLLLQYKDFIKNFLVLKDNNKEITNFKDVLKYIKNEDLISLPVIIILKKHLDIIKDSLYFNEIEQLSKLEGEKYTKEEEKIINKYLYEQQKNIKEFLENNLVFINSKEFNIDIDKIISKNHAFSILDNDFLLMINDSPNFCDKIQKINKCFLFKNNNNFYILYSGKNKLYKLNFIGEFEFTLKEEDFNQEFKNTLKNIKQMIEFEEFIQNLIKSNLNNISNPEEFYLINSKWMKKYKNFYNYKEIISNKNKDDNYLFNYISNKQSFPDDLKNQNNLYPDIDRNFSTLKVPINFEIINKALFDCIIQDIKEKTNADLKTTYSLKILLGDNKLFIQNNSNQKLYYIYNEAYELKYIIQFDNIDLINWLQSKSYSNFEDLVSNFGVDLSKEETQFILDDKLEKLGEIKIIKASNQIHSIKEPNHCLGLENIGATCYMNATIQCLCHVLNMKNYFQDRQSVYKDTNNKNCPLTLEFYNLVKNLWKDNYHRKNYFTPRDFKSLISQMNPLFKGIAANDSKDLIIFIYENMHNEINKEGQYNNYNNNYQNNKTLQLFRKNYYSLNSSFLIDTFYFEQQSDLKCLSCKFNKASYNIANILIFPLEKVREFVAKKSPDGFISVTLENCFENYQEVEILSGQNQIFCNNCKRMSNASTGNKMFTSPEVMTIILNRGKGLEFQVEFEYPLFLNIDKYVIDKSQNNNNNYELICVLTHLGPSGMSGHFIAFCKSPNDGKWYCYNDATVTEIDNPTENDDGEFESVPYVLFYQRCSQDKILNNNNSNIRRNRKKNSTKYNYNNIESSGINIINNNDIITLYFSYKTKEFYLDVDKNEIISNLIKKLNKKYNIPKNVTFYKQAGDNLLEIKSSKTVKDNNLKNENKIVVLDEDPYDYGDNNINDNNYSQYYYYYH